MMAKLHPFHRPVAENIFKKNLGTNTVRFNIRGVSITKGRHLVMETDQDDYVASILETLEHFGHLIPVLEVNYHDEVALTKINRHLNKYAKESLIDITLTRGDLEQLKGPFDRVERVCIEHTYIDTNRTNLRAIFPNVYRLQLTTLSFKRPMNIEQHFPHLQEMIVESSLRSDSLQLRRRLQLNPQLLKLTIDKGNWNGLRIINELLPRLESLTFTTFDESSDAGQGDIHFPDMKVFDVVWVQKTLNNHEGVSIIFGNLERLICHGSNRCFVIMVQNKRLQEIICDSLSDEELQQIGTELIDLKKVWMKHSVRTNDDIDKFVQFIEMSKQLNKIVLRESEIADMNEIRERLENKWEVSNAGGNNHIFTRIQTVDDAF